MRLTGIVEDGNSAVAVQLDFKNESGESNGDLTLSAIMGRHEFRQSLLGRANRNQQTKIRSPSQRSEFGIAQYSESRANVFSRDSYFTAI